jgi:hypothetical protein
MRNEQENQRRDDLLPKLVDAEDVDDLLEHPPRP